jgi:hypothetical protein
MSLNICLLVFLSGTYTVPLVLGLAVPYRYMYIRVHYDNVTCVYIYISHMLHCGIYSSKALFSPWFKN